MKKIGLFLFLLIFAQSVHGQSKMASLGYCWYAAGSSWIPMAATTAGTAISIPPFITYLPWLCNIQAFGLERV